MRHAVVAGWVLAGWTAASTAAAKECEDAPCAGNPRWSGVELRTGSPMPPDGAFMLEATRGRQACLAEVDPQLTVTVRRDGVGVPGEVAQMEGLPDVFIWRPEGLLTVGATYELLVEVDNAAMRADHPDGACGPDLLSEQFFVEVGGQAGWVPTVEPPGVAYSGVAVEDFRAMACCPGEAPAVDGCSGRPSWYSDTCASVYHYAWLWFYASTIGGSDGVRTQFAAQIVVDEEVVGRSVIGRSNAFDLSVLRSSPACARMELVHVKTGEVAAKSADACPTADVVALIGPRLIDVDRALDCEAVMCGDAHGWGDACVPFEASTPPPLPPLVEGFVPVCEAASVPAEVSDGPAPPMMDEGCGCVAVGGGGWWLCLPVWVLRRRRR